MTERFATVGYQTDWLATLDSAFMRNALIGGTVVALAAGLIGYFVVVRQTAFAAHALAHIGLPGATGAVLLGVSPVLGLGAFCVAGAVMISMLGSRASERDVVTGTVLAFATGLGLFFNSVATRNSGTMTNVLFGNLLAITPEQLAVFAAVLVAVALTVGITFRQLLYSSINPTVAAAKGVPVGALSLVFMILLGLTVTMAIQAVGTLLLFALVITPAATAIAVTARPVLAMAISTGLAVGGVWLGLILSAMFNAPPSFLIVTTVTAVWLVVVLRQRGNGRRAPAEHQSRVVAG